MADEEHHRNRPIRSGQRERRISRVVLDQVSKQIGRPIVVENRGGAGGTLGTNMVAKAAPDGYTILATGALATAHSLYPNLPYDTLRDFVPVIPLGQQPLVLVTSPSRGFNTLGDLIAAAKSQTGALNFASSGIGSASHFAAERLRVSADFEAQHIPFRGATEGLTEVLAGRVDFFFVPLAPALALINDGRLLALAVSTLQTGRCPAASADNDGSRICRFAYDFWVGLFLPAKTPHDIVVRLHNETATALQMPHRTRSAGKLGVEPMPMSPQQFRRLFQGRPQATAGLVKIAKISIAMMDREIETVCSSSAQARSA